MDNLSVSQYLDLLNDKLKLEKAKIVGEVSGIQEYPGRSYLYFSLKDAKDQSSIKCFMWKGDYRLSGVKLEEGLEISILAYPNIYKPNGGLTLQVESIELVGEGALKKAYDLLKDKLSKEGLFDIGRKKSLPTYTRKIGVITSKNGAVINDFLTNIGKYGFEILFIDSKVEGAEAIKDLMSAVSTFEKKDIDVLVIMRGGGSLESFAAFNNEELVRMVANFPIPVVTGIGHDKDVPLLSMVSDINVSTPTAVAHYINKNWDEVVSFIKLSEEKILSSYSSVIQNTRFNIEHTGILLEQKLSKIIETFYKIDTFLVSSLKQLERSIYLNRDKLKDFDSSIKRGMTGILEKTKNKIDQFGTLLKSYDPQNQLKKGYSIIKIKDKVVRKVSDVEKDQKIDIIVSDGIIRSKII